MRPPYRGGRPAWSTALRSGRSPYRFAGSNPAPRIKNPKDLNLDAERQRWFESCPPHYESKGFEPRWR